MHAWLRAFIAFRSCTTASAAWAVRCHLTTAFLRIGKTPEKCVTSSTAARMYYVITDAAAISQYKSIVGALLHIANNTRPDIAFSVSYFARFTAKPTCGCFARLMDVLLYLKGTASYGLRLGGPGCVLHGYCDSDWAGCPQSRSSTTGFVIKCGWGSFSWKSAEQPAVSRLLSQAEYVAAGEVAKDVQYFIDMAPTMGEMGR